MGEIKTKAEDVTVENSLPASMSTWILAILPPLLAFVASSFGLVANFYCETVKFPQVEGNDDLVLYAGLWSFRTPDLDIVGNNTNDMFKNRRCTHYHDYYHDFNKTLTEIPYTFGIETEVVWTFAIVVLFFSYLYLIMLCCSPFNAAARGSGTIFFLLRVVVPVFQGITLLVQSSSICTDNPAIQILKVNYADFAETLPPQCELAIGFWLNVASVALWASAGFLYTFAFPPPQQEEAALDFAKGHEEDAVEVEETKKEGSLRV